MTDPYYDDGTCTIYHGDCRDVLPDVSGDLLLTDPPYNLGIDYGTVDDDLPPSEYASLIQEWWSLTGCAERIVFPGLANLPLWCRYIGRPLAIGCWYIPGNPGRGFPWSFVEWEPILIYGTTMLGGSNVLRHPVTKQRNVGDHPCPKPLALFRELVYRSRASEVLDQFMGSGTTFAAAKDLGRRAIGIEIEERYCEIAARRLAQEVLPLGEVS